MQVIAVNHMYASALRRLGAWFIDMTLISFMLLVISPWHFQTNYGFFFKWSFAPGIKWVVVLLYYALMESSKHKATIGKIALGMQVVDVKGQRLDFSKALLRNLCKFISAAIFCVGYIMIIFDSRKQGLHDKIADALVVRK